MNRFSSNIALAGTLAASQLPSAAADNRFEYQVGTSLESIEFTHGNPFKAAEGLKGRSELTFNTTALMLRVGGVLRQGDIEINSSMGLPVYTMSHHTDSDWIASDLVSYYESAGEMKPVDLEFSFTKAAGQLKDERLQLRLGAGVRYDYSGKFVAEDFNGTLGLAFSEGELPRAVKPVLMVDDDTRDYPPITFSAQSLTTEGLAKAVFIVSPKLKTELVATLGIRYSQTHDHHVWREIKYDGHMIGPIAGLNSISSYSFSPDCAVFLGINSSIAFMEGSDTIRHGDKRGSLHNVSHQYELFGINIGISAKF